MAERNSPPLKDTGLPCPSILEGALGEGKKAEGSRRSGFLKVRPQISCIKVLRGSRGSTGNADSRDWPHLQEVLTHQALGGLGNLHL